MENQALSINQMYELIRLGIDTSNASMHWMSGYYDYKSQKWLNHDLGVGYDSEIPYPEGKYIPAFTFQDIIELLPNYINVDGIIYFKTLLYGYSDGVVIIYCAEYTENALHTVGNSKQIDAAFEMLKWCKQNNYMK